ncbi:MAG: hypothetical protein GY771_04110 [bacterium]|nr:hypothetical protein [bacterium]
MFNYDGYLNENYPSFVWLLFPIALISIAAGAALYFLPAYTNLIFGAAVVLIIFFEVWLALGGKRWMLAWGLITIVPLVIALLVAFGEYRYISFAVFVIPVNGFIAVDALYYRRIIPGILHIALAVTASAALFYANGLYAVVLPFYFGIYAVARLIDYVSIRVILSGRDSPGGS